jgi:3-oxoadipate enol-lactonase
MEESMNHEKTMLAFLVMIFCGSFSLAQGSEATSGMAEVNGTTLYYESAGKGSAVVFLHGGLLSSAEWDEQFSTFAEHYRVIRYDARGYGKSAVRRLPFSPVEDLYQLLRFLNVSRVSLIGGSMGGAVAIDFALEHPEMVDSLVLVGPALGGWPYSPAFVQRMYQIILATVAEGAEKGAEMLLAVPYIIPAPENFSARQKFHTLFTANFHGFLAPWYLARPLAPPALQRLSLLHTRTLLVIGQMEDPENLAVLDTLAMKVVDAKKVTISQVGHLPQMENPAEFNRLVLDFLSKR